MKAGIYSLIAMGILTFIYLIAYTLSPANYILLFMFLGNIFLAINGIFWRLEELENDTK